MNLAKYDGNNPWHALAAGAAFSLILICWAAISMMLEPAAGGPRPTDHGTPVFCADPAEIEPACTTWIDADGHIFTPD